MGFQSESIKGIKIRVFKWIQNMIKHRVLFHHHQLGSSTKFGFLLLRVKNQIRIVKPRNCCSKNRGGQIKKTTFKKSVQPFKICEYPDEFVESIELALGLSNLFFKDTTPHLANTIYDYLSSSFECFGKKLNLLSTNMDDEFNKIVVAIDVDMQSGRFEIGAQRSNDVCSFQLTDLYETLMNDGDNEDKEGKFYLQVDGDQESFVEVKDAKHEFYLQIDGVQKSCGELNIKRTIDVSVLSKNFETGSQSSNDVRSFQSIGSYVTLVNNGDNKDKDDEFYLQVDGVVNKKRRIDVQKIHVLEVEYTFDDYDIQEILNTLMEFLTTRRGFHNKVEVFDGKIQEFREVKSGLKIVNLKKENVVSFELGDICPVCFEIFEEKSVVVITPCSHMFHRSCIFTWLPENNNCPICRQSCDV